MGVLFSGLDMMRRASLEELMHKEERAEINKELRLSILLSHIF
jgi:hypothetical protein